MPVTVDYDSMGFLTTAQVVERSVTVNKNSPIQDYIYPDDQTQPTFERVSIVKDPFHFLSIKKWSA